MRIFRYRYVRFCSKVPARLNLRMIPRLEIKRSVQQRRRGKGNDEPIAGDPRMRQHDVILDPNQHPI